jgi:peptide/nickel transport system substrate-binding protein
MLRSRARQLIVGLVAAALLLGACASEESGGGGSDDPAGGGAASNQIQAGWSNEPELEPTSGGTLEVTLAAPPPGLDPNSGTLGLPTQGPVFTAIYDSLMRYDPDTGELTGHLAEGFTHNDDFTEWTLKLRPGVNFTDGTPLNSAAVVYSLERIATARNAASTYPAYFSSVETPDDLTVVFRLDTPLNNVDAMFAAELGFIVSPTAAQAAGEGFANNPVGAGPFKVESFAPDSELVLVKNPDYALGDVRLDGIRMTWSSDQGANLDKVMTGQSDMAFLNNVQGVSRAIDSGLPVYTTLVGGNGIAINNAAGRAFPGNDPRVRQAIGMAADPELMNERVNDGRGVVGRWLLPPGNRFYVDNPYSVGDVEGARELLAEVKAETGWDGSLTLVTPPPDDQALAFQAQLNAVGFNVTVEPLASFTQLIERILLNRDFDLSIWTMTTYDTNIYQALSRTLLSTSPSNYLSFDSPEMDALLGQLREAADEDAFREVLNEIALQWQTDQPFMYTGTQPYSTIVTDEVGGIIPTAIGVFLWNEVFKA